MTEYDPLESRLTAAQNIVYDPDTATRNIDRLVADAYDYYSQTGMAAHKPHETLYNISRMARQVTSGALGHSAIVPAIMEATLEGRDQAYTLEHVAPGQSPRWQYSEAHPRMIYYTATGDTVNGTAITLKAVGESPALNRIQDQTITTFCGASEALLPEEMQPNPIWEVFTNVHDLYASRWLDWKKHDETAGGNTKHLQVSARDSWLTSLAGNARLVIGLVAADTQTNHETACPPVSLANAANAKQRSRATELAINIIKTAHGNEEVCPAEYKRLLYLLRQNGEGSGLCGGRLKLKTRPEHITIAQEFAGYTGYPLAIEKGFSLVDVMFAYVAKKLRSA